MTTWPLAARAQQPALPVIGILQVSAAETDPKTASAFRKGLSESGYIDGQTVAIEFFASGGGDPVQGGLVASLNRPGGNVTGISIIMTALLPKRLETPVRIVAGADDQVVPGSNAEFLHERLPNAQVDLIAGAGHFCWEEKPAEYAALLTSWWDRANAASKS